MRRTSIHALALISVAALALVAAGCGGGGSKSAATTTAALTTEETTTEAATTTEEALTTEESTTSEETTTASNLPAGLSKNCRDFVDLGQKFSSAFSGASSSKDLKKQVKLFEEFASKAPEDIRADFKVVADAFSKLVEALGGTSLKSGEAPSAEALQKLQSLSGEIDQQKFTQASQHISTWVQNNCKS